MSKAIKIAKPGYNVIETADNNLVFNSDYPLFKVHKKGSGHKVVLGNGSYTGEEYVIYHNVGKIPLYMVRGQIVDSLFNDTKTENYLQYPGSRYFGLNMWGLEKVIPYPDKLVIKWFYPALSTAKDLHFDYWIFEDPIIL